MKCSIIVPIYNSAFTLNKCVDSLLCQTYQDIEVVLVDDGSNDGSPTICDEYIDKDARIKVIHQINLGRSEARYAGVKSATGEWVTFVDSDDSLKPNAIASFMAAVSSDVDIVIGSGKELYRWGVRKDEVISNEKLRPLAVRAEGQIGLMWGNMFRRSRLTHAMFDMNGKLPMGEDYIFWLRLVFSDNVKAVTILGQNYVKGKSHTCNSFTWTPEYASKINEMRCSAIPAALHKQYLPDMLEDRICNLCLVSFWTPRKDWLHCQFREDILSDMRLVQRKFTIKEHIIFCLPSCLLRRKFYGFCNRMNNYFCAR